MKLLVRTWLSPLDRGKMLFKILRGFRIFSIQYEVVFKCMIASIKLIDVT